MGRERERERDRDRERQRERGQKYENVYQNLLILIQMKCIYEAVVFKVLATITLHLLLLLPKRGTMASFLSLLEEIHLNQDTFCQIIQTNWGKSKSFTPLWRVLCMIYPSQISALVY